MGERDRDDAGSSSFACSTLFFFLRVSNGSSVFVVGRFIGYFLGNLFLSFFYLDIGGLAKLLSMLRLKKRIYMSFFVYRVLIDIYDGSFLCLCVRVSMQLGFFGCLYTCSFWMGAWIASVCRLRQEKWNMEVYVYCII